MIKSLEMLEVVAKKFKLLKNTFELTISCFPVIATIEVILNYSTIVKVRVC
jgi:hypothetical protein